MTFTALALKLIKQQKTTLQSNDNRSMVNLQKSSNYLRRLSMTRHFVIFQIAIFLSYFVTSIITHADTWNGSLYRDNSNIQYDVAERVLKDVDILKPSPIVLDIGCGDGRSTSELILKHLKAKSVLGIDPSDSMLSKAKKSYRTNQQLAFAKGSFQTLNDRNAYDAITSFFALHWVPKAEQALAIKNVTNALKTGGVFIAVHVVDSKRPILKTAIDQTIATPKWRSYFQNYQSQVYWADAFEFQNLLTENRLRLRRFVAFDYPTRFEDAKAFYSWVNAWSQLKDRLGNKHEAFWMDVINTYRTQTNQDHQVPEIKFTDSFVEIIAEKM
jgi:trans-aconitate methyltransferase